MVDRVSFGSFALVGAEFSLTTSGQILEDS